MGEGWSGMLFGLKILKITIRKYINIKYFIINY